MNGYPTVALSAGSKAALAESAESGQTTIRKPLKTTWTEPVVGLSLGPAKRNPVVVGFSYIFVDIAVKFFRTIDVGTNIELAFIDQKRRWIGVRQFAFAQGISAE